MKVKRNIEAKKCDFGELNPGECFCIDEIAADKAYVCLAEAEGSIYDAAHLTGGTQVNFDYTQPVILLKDAEILLFGGKK